MLKAKEIRKMKLEDINKLIKDIEYEQIKASSIWARNQVETKKVGLKGIGKKGDKTSLQKDLRRTKARLLTIKHEIENGK